MNKPTPREPIRIIGAEVDEENLVVNRNGEIRHDAMVIIHPEDMGKLRAGYYCARCYEPQDKPFPKECWLCKFPMSDKQSEFIAKGYRGNVRVGPSSSVEDEMAFMQEWQEREDMKRRDEITRPSQIWLPGRGI